MRLLIHGYRELERRQSGQRAPASAPYLAGMNSLSSLAAVLLVAGRSTRMGQSKALLPLGGMPLCRHAAQTLVEVGYGEIWAVLPPGETGDAVRAALQGLPLRGVTNPQPAQGLLSSFQAAGEALWAESAAPAVVFTLADMPLVRRDTHQALGTVFGAEQPAAIITRYGEVAAPPTLLRRDLLPRLHEFPPSDHGPRTLLRELGRELKKIDRPAAELLDIDTPEAWAQAQQLFAEVTPGAQDGP